MQRKNSFGKLYSGKELIYCSDYLNSPEDPERTQMTNLKLNV
jgi:hypothetical protein